MAQQVHHGAVPLERPSAPAFDLVEHGLLHMFCSVGKLSLDTVATDMSAFDLTRSQSSMLPDPARNAGPWLQNVQRTVGLNGMGFH